MASRIAGQIGVDLPGYTGPAFDYASGGGGRGAAPEGTWPINSFNVNPSGSRVAEGWTVGGPGGTMPDPRYPNDPRTEIMIHAGSTDNLDKLYSAGCFAIPPSEWPAFKDQLMSLQKQYGELALVVGPNGTATIRQASAADKPVSPSLFMQATNAVQQGAQLSQVTDAVNQVSPASEAQSAPLQWSNEDLSKVMLGQTPSFAQQPDPSAFTAPSNGGLGNVPFFGSAEAEGSTPPQVASTAPASLPAWTEASPSLADTSAINNYYSHPQAPTTGGFFGLDGLTSALSDIPGFVAKAQAAGPDALKAYFDDPANKMHYLYAEKNNPANPFGFTGLGLASSPAASGPTQQAKDFWGNLGPALGSSMLGGSAWGSPDTSATLDRADWSPSPSSNIDFGPAWGKQEGKPEDNPLSDQWKPPALDMTGAMNPFGMGFDLNNAKFNTAPAPNVSLSPATSLYSTAGLGTPGYNAFAGSNLLSGSKPTSQPSQPSSGGAFSLPAPTVGGPLPSWANNLHELNQVATPASFNPMTESIPSNGGSQYDYTIGQNSAGQNVTSWNTGNGVQQILTDVPGGMSYSDAGNPSGETLKAALCSHYMLRGWLDREIWRADTRYSMTLPIEMRVGYQAWAKPLSRWLKSDAIARPLAERMLWPIIRGWSYEMAHRYGAVSRGSFIGKIALATLGPISSAIGRRILSRQLVRI